MLCSAVHLVFARELLNGGLVRECTYVHTV